MVRSSYMRYTHTAELLNKTTATNDTGQRMPVWSVVTSSLRCFASPSSMKASLRVTPTIEQGDFLTFYAGPEESINYSSRIRNIKKNNKIIFAGPYEVQDIKNMIGFTGGVQYKEITLKLVVE